MMYKASSPKMFPASITSLTFPLLLLLGQGAFSAFLRRTWLQPRLEILDWDRPMLLLALKTHRFLVEGLARLLRVRLITAFGIKKQFYSLVRLVQIVEVLPSSAEGWHESLPWIS